MKKTMIVLTALLTAGFLATNAFAWGHGKGKRGGCGGQGYNAMASLTPEQQTELKTLRQKFIDETYETRAAMMDKHQQIRLLMETSSPDKAKLEKLSNEMLDLKKAVQDKRIDFVLEAKKIAPELNMSAFGHGRGGFGKGGYGNKGGGFGSCPWSTGGQAVTQ
ncbi:MAG: periplasmic heavy metal sensor [Desulfobacterales bacterium]|nr:periplasmic heavy metal sensor [Desulfobacterales bacterium]